MLSIVPAFLTPPRHLQCEDRPLFHLSPSYTQFTRIILREIEAKATANMCTSLNASDSNTAAVSLVQDIVPNELANLNVVQAACTIASPTSASVP